MSAGWVVDTDMVFHKSAPDSAVRSAALKICRDNTPLSISEFTKVEIKGNVISCLTLLRRKIESSSSFSEALAKVQNSGSGPSIRRVVCLFVEFMKLIGCINRPPEPWTDYKGLLLTRIDSEIYVLWNSLAMDVDKVLNDFNCTRATEEPRVINGQWSNIIPRCSPENTTCTIVNYMSSSMQSLTKLEDHLSKLPATSLTKELAAMLEAVRTTIKSGKFPWQGTTCRGMGDLLIGLQSKSIGGLITSNYKEHSQLSGPIGYRIKLFPLAQIRQKECVHRSS